jgi:hypothetical protein
MRKKKLPYFIRYIRYTLNCIFNLFFPIGIEEEDFTKHFKNRNK